VGGGNELTNLELTRLVLEECDRPRSLMRLVEDRPGHDRRYAIDSSKLHARGWQPRHEFRAALRQTVDWYRSNEGWWRPLKTAEYLEYYRRQYAGRLASGTTPD
jgi:dTDP-glucose 4,6-dehydratase